MVLEGPKPAFVFAGLFLLLIVVVAGISNVWPKQEAWFFELGLFGENKTADRYFNNANSAVEVGAVNNWFIYVHNHMGTEEVVSVRTKLLDSTMELPDDREHQPSLSAPFTEFPISMSENETAFIPFSWSVVEAETKSGSTFIKRLLVNDRTFDLEVFGSSDSFFRVVFELWVQNQNTGEYVFGWESKEGFSSASIYMAFKLNSSVP